MSILEGEGIAVAVGRGWEAEIYRRAPGAPSSPTTSAPLRGSTTASLAPAAAEAGEPVLRYPPILHLATFPLPTVRGDYGGGALAGMGATDAFVALFDHGPEAAETALFAHDVPWPLGPDDFDPRMLRVPVGNQSGCQKFFRSAGRGFCLYAVIGSHTLRRLSIASLNAVLATVEFR